MYGICENLNLITKNMLKINVIISWGIMLSFISQAQSIPNLLDQRALSGTLQIKYKNGTASAFQYKGIDSVGYLITAKHIFATKFQRKIENGKTVKYLYYDSLLVSDGEQVDVKIFYNSGWINLDARLFFDNNKGDVAILRTNIPMEGNSYNFGANDLYVSQECFFIGYPLGLRMDFSKRPGFAPYPIPFVRKGIFSALGNITDGFVTKYFIDGHNTYGFSGGPLLYYNWAKKAYYVAGVISGYIPQENHLYKDDGSEATSEENSGLMEVYNIEYAIRILKRLKCM